MKWVQVVDIRDLGSTLIMNLCSNGKIRSISDIYALSLEDLIPFFLNEESVAKEKKSLGAEKVLKSIQNHRRMSLATFVAGFDIEGIGETTVEKLVAAGYNTLEKLLSLTEEQIAKVYGFAQVMAKIAVEGFAENREEMEKLALNTITIEKSAEGLLNGKSFCFTGELVRMKRSEAEKIVKSLGGICKSSVTKDLSYLVTNNPASGSSKNKKAVELGIPVIDESAFFKLIGQ